ncbi:ABC-type branched-subunit amino acid transport system substrate-binding protein [Streptomyces sp. SAI-135]|uniref:bifunctional serine/threonine-protein kinase/ABC transporter substrate-binding protein n=1 Tax=unclassified Streptomyces TaxID=2593676 RepID=UPI00247717BD|nr:MULTISPECIES: bifunctional serine/threonine-protein kinase/ABC transporter substrate-binding protein [unclassified Streptomyces]MDH6523407.1 ABC-type branched-subunit amino acid transport system substrate-binding protein [Streptomyces sp. SAI-090]MDH6574295.1 ABC-type branched-subunit amino acid transport system substrate-binding protein [Streptomyces sp. SAI-117]MDH6612980.1 ABC-type branched-subunit amino acid transport system substrate-binding protein [Streptomyces sp. SAI-135]
MQPLTAADPEDISGHRLLARLGAGGMGVVYLARTTGGALVALKTIRAEHAADPAFRTRFRREVTAVRGLTGRWLVPVVAADTEAQEPWLATEFVPGPSLVEAVDGFGALPVAAVRTLGSRLADALTAVHAAGVVHRDVKPGNVLLALDGPRLIDFGIAYAAGATELTAPDAVVGTPGFLAPEQAQARAGEVGPPSDVFSLGCVLAYAASGRRPFGTGNAAGVLFRTVHEEPDLADVPSELQALTGACLAKDPTRRPTAQEAAAMLRDPRIPLAREISENQQGHWLPPALLRVVAERSARALDVPTPQRPTRQPTDEARATDPTPSHPKDPRPATRRRVLLMGSAAAASLAAVGGGATAYLAAGKAVTGGALPVHTLGFQADLSGTNKADGLAQERGARLAVEHHNARAGITFRLALDTADDRGDATRAKQAAQRLTEAGVSAVLGPNTATAALAAGPLYQAADTGMVLISVDDARLDDARLRTLCITRAPEDYLALPLISYLTDVRPVDRTAVIDDRAAGPTGSDLTNFVAQNPPQQGTSSVHSVAAESDDFGPAVRAALAARAQAVVFSGTSPERAARCARALTEAGFSGPRLGTWHIMHPAFLQQAGTAGHNWLFGTPFTDPGSVSRDFRAAYRAKYGTTPGRWSPEAYDAVGLVARALKSLGGSADIRPRSVTPRLFGVTYKGLAKTFHVSTDGIDPQKSGALYFLFQAKGNAFHFLGRYDQVK